MKVLVTGIDGYIGAILGPYLMQRGYDVTGFDTGYYRQGWLYPMSGPRPEGVTAESGHPPASLHHASLGADRPWL